MRIYILKNGAQVGPYSADEILSRIGSGEFANTDLAWHEGLATWASIPNVLGTKPAVPPPLPSPEKPRRGQVFAATIVRMIGAVIIGAGVAAGLGVEDVLINPIGIFCLLVGLCIYHGAHLIHRPVIPWFGRWPLFGLLFLSGFVLAMVLLSAVSDQFPPDRLRSPFLPGRAPGAKN